MQPTLHDLLTSGFLSSQPVTRQVLSAYMCLTTVFGMGTGGTIQASSPDILFLSVCTLKTIQKKLLCIDILGPGLNRSILPEGNIPSPLAL